MLSDQLKTQIESLIANHKILVFMKGTKEQPQCGFSGSVVSILNHLTWDYECVNVLQNQEIREGIKEFSKWPTIPQVFINGEFVGGSDILQDLYESGELYALLKLDVSSKPAPSLKCTESAVKAFLDAQKEARDDEHIRIRINANFDHALLFDQKNESDINLTQNGLTFIFDPLSAQRANGLVLDFENQGLESGFAFENPNVPPPVKEMSPAQLFLKRQEDPDLLVLDVRTKEEWMNGHMDFAKLFCESDTHIVKSHDKEKPIVFHCQSGRRSRMMAEKFRHQGFLNVYNLSGGLNAWLKERGSNS